jgi:phage repressor protein C with HTH and peptisase S24 domain
MSIGENLRVARESRGKNQTELGASVGLNRRVISEWENGKKEPTIGQLRKMAGFLDIPLSNLTGEIKSMENSTILTGSAARDGATIYNSPDESLESNAKPIGRLIYIPVISPRATLCCGEGNGLEGVEPEVINHLPVDLDTIDAFGIDVHELRAMKTEGSSMEPAVREGDFVIYDPTAEVRHGDIGVVEFRDRWYVRGVLIEPEDKITLRSKNREEYPDIVIKWGDERYKAHGRVIGIQTPMRRCSGIL